MRKCNCGNCLNGKPVDWDSVEGKANQEYCSECKIEMIAGNQGNPTKWKATV